MTASDPRHRIGLLSDSHANLPALVAALDALRAREVSLIVHLGDAIGLGPHPAEVVDLLRSEQVLCLAGLWERGLGRERFLLRWRRADVHAHRRWVRAQLGRIRIRELASWPASVQIRVGSQLVHFTHWPQSRQLHDDHFDDRHPLRLAHRFAGEAGDCDIVCYGRNHIPNDVSGVQRFVNPGAVGCSARAQACWGLLDAQDPAVRVDLDSASYDITTLFADLQQRAVPGAETIRRLFYGGR